MTYIWRIIHNILLCTPTIHSQPGTVKWGQIPKNYVQMLGHVQTVEAVYALTANDPRQLAFKRGDRILVLDVCSACAYT